MITVTTDLLNARLKTVEVRTDARILAIEASTAEFGRLFKEFRAEIRADIKNLKITMVVTAIASVLAIAAINATIYSNMLAAFQSGKELATIQAELSASQADIKRLIQQIDAREHRRGDHGEAGTPPPN